MMSSKEKAQTKKGDKLTQLVQNFFFKASNIIVQSRCQLESIDSGRLRLLKLNKWFNIQLNDVLSKDELKLWKLSSSIVNEETNSILNLPPLVIEIYLDLRLLSPSQTLILQENGIDYNVTQGNSKNELIMERWLLEFDLNTFDLEVNQLPSIYKNILISFRILYAFTRLLPCFKLRQRMAKTTLNQSLSIGYRILDGNLPIHSKGRIGLSKNLIDHSVKENLQTKKFDPIITNVGSLRMSVSYRANCNFTLNDKEQVLSSQFLKMDTGNGSGSGSGSVSATGSNDNEFSSSNVRDQEESPAPDSNTQSTQVQPLQIKENRHLKRLSMQSNYSLSPGSIFLKEFSPSQTKLRRSSSSLSRIHPFKVGSVSSSILHQQQQQLPLQLQQQLHSTTPPYLTNESSFSHDNNSTTSLLAMLRQQRASFSSQQTQFKPLYVGSIDSSISHDSNTPRFSSSFGSRYRRQKSSSKITDDDDLDQFIKQLDTKPDLRLSISPQESLEKYQNMQKNHNTLSESMNASILQNPPSNSQRELRLINYDQTSSSSKRLVTYPGGTDHDSHHYESAIIDDDDDDNVHDLDDDLDDDDRTRNNNRLGSRATATSTLRVNSDNNLRTLKPRGSSRNNNDEEEDLLFTMSDMNLR